MPVLVVTLVGGVVKSADMNGFSDPYVVLTVGKEQKKSKVLKKTLTPFWNEDIVLNTAKPGDEVLVEVFDWDRFSKDDPLGECCIQINSLPKSHHYFDTFDLIDKSKNNEVIGQICLGLHPRGMGTNNQVKPKLRYIRIGGKDGRLSWESSSFWSRNFELTARVDAYGKLFGKYPSFLKGDEKEWHEIVDGKITPEGDVNIPEIKYYVEKEENHERSSKMVGTISKKKNVRLFEGTGTRTFDKSGDQDKVGKNFSCRGEVNYTPIPVIFWKLMKKDVKLKFFNNFDCVANEDEDSDSESDDDE